jgi:hypothetical protein
MINNIIQDQMVVIGKGITNQIRVTDIINKLIIIIIDFGKMLWDLFATEKKAMSGIIVLFGIKLLKEKRWIPNWKLE